MFRREASTEEGTENQVDRDEAKTGTDEHKCGEQNALQPSRRIKEGDDGQR